MHFHKTKKERQLIHLSMVIFRRKSKECKKCMHELYYLKLLLFTILFLLLFFCYFLHLRILQMIKLPHAISASLSCRSTQENLFPRSPQSFSLLPINENSILSHSFSIFKHTSYKTQFSQSFV